MAWYIFRSIRSERVNDVNDYLKVGDTVPVKVLEIDRQRRVRLSMKVAAEKPAEANNEQATEQTGREKRRLIVNLYSVKASVELAQRGFFCGRSNQKGIFYAITLAKALLAMTLKQDGNPRRRIKQGKSQHRHSMSC